MYTYTRDSHSEAGKLWINFAMIYFRLTQMAYLHGQVMVKEGKEKNSCYAGGNTLFAHIKEWSRMTTKAFIPRMINIFRKGSGDFTMKVPPPTTDWSALDKLLEDPGEFALKVKEMAEKCGGRMQIGEDQVFYEISISVTKENGKEKVKVDETVLHTGDNEELYKGMFKVMDSTFQDMPPLHPMHDLGKHMDHYQPKTALSA